MILTPAELDAIQAHAVRDYPSECCGVLLTRGGERRLMPLRNVQDELHRRDPARYPRDSRTAYHVHPEDALAVERAVQQGFRVAVLYHSHIDTGAYLSETDRRQALLGQDPREHDPLFPDAVYLVLSVLGGKVAGMAGFRWERARRDFAPVDLEGETPA